MLEPLLAIPGPLFLVLFWTLVLILLFACKAWVDRSSAPSIPPPDPARLAPQTLAALRGGANAVIRMVTYKLWQEGRVKIAGEGRQSRLGRVEGLPAPQDRLERLILDACRSPLRPKDLFLRLGSTVDGILAGDFLHLERLGLLQGPEAQSRAWTAVLSGTGLLWAVGGTKLALGILRDRPVGFLVVSLVAAPLLFLLAIKPFRDHRPTPAGKAFLKDARERLAWMVTPPAQGSPDPAPQMILAMALFGMTALAPNPLNEDFRRTFGRGEGSGGAGCSGGCGSGSTSDSGGGDGGGGDGGGCGGCGGCRGGD